MQTSNRLLAVDADSSASWRGSVALGEADGKPGRYYVTARNERGQTAYLLGPFVQPTLGQQGHARALGAVRKARRYCDEHHLNPFNELAFGTGRLSLYGEAPTGKLNDLA